MNLRFYSLGMMAAIVAFLPTAAMAFPVTQLPETSQAVCAGDFQELEIEGSIIVYDANENKAYEHNPERNQTAFSPASTFKILNSMIALESGAIQDDLAILTWDGFERSIPIWNQDYNLRRAFRFSTVWFYQVLARRTGYERMKNWVTAADYGNQNIGDESDIDTFWLGGDLEITPRQQIDFLQRFYLGDLPFAAENIALVKDIMIVEQTPEYIIRAKTGWANTVGWYVGYLERDENVYFFATNIVMRGESDAPHRITVTRRCLAGLGVL